MKLFLALITFAVLVLSLGSIGYLFMYGEVLFGIVSSLLTLIAGVTYFVPKVQFPKGKDILEA